MRSILVSVDYADILAVTLAYNRHHFNDVMVVTSPEDHQTAIVAKHHECQIFRTDLFYSRGAVFNKWLALETALDIYGREGWICIMDADVLWPKNLSSGFYESLVVGNIYTPFRRMWANPTVDVPPESEWCGFHRHRQEVEFAGYSQMFHCSDLVLGNPPWHQTDWLHAGGADSWFQAKWKNTNKIRPSWDVLHLGPAGTNWCGRSTPYLDGSIHPRANERLYQLTKFLRTRQRLRSYDHEKL